MILPWFVFLFSYSVFSSEYRGYLTQVYWHGGFDGKTTYEQEESNPVENMEEKVFQGQGWLAALL